MVIVNKALPSISAAASGPDGASELSSTASVAGGQKPTGSLSLDLYGPDDPSCTGPPVFSSPNHAPVRPPRPPPEPIYIPGIPFPFYPPPEKEEVLTLLGYTAQSGLYTASASGTYRWTAAYSGDANNDRVVSSCGAAGTTSLLDLDPPTTTDDVPSGTQSHPVAVTLSAADGGSGVDKTYFTKGASPADPTTDSAVYAADAKPVLDDGERIKYFSVDQAGNAEAVRSSAPARVAPTPALDPPAISTHPTASTTSRTATFEFRGQDGATYECSLDDAPFEDCATPHTYRDLELGEHEFQVRQVDSGGSASAAAVDRWTVVADDSPLPATRVDAIATDPRQGAGRPAVVADANDALDVGCALDQGSLSSCEVDAFAAVPSPGAARSARTRRVLVGHGSRVFDVPGTRQATVRLTLSDRGRELLASSPRGLALTLEVTARSYGSDRVLRNGLRLTALSRVAQLAPPSGMFDPLSADLDAGARRYLRALRGTLSRARSVRCEGHTAPSETRSRTDLKNLGLRRSRAVCSYLRQLGVRARLSVHSFGPARPRAGNETRRGRALNRRVELSITR